jgi:pilin isopeptide linkage protein
MKGKIIWLLTGLACLLVLGASLVWAWENTHQHKTFVSQSRTAQSAVTLKKYALDAKGDKTTQPLSGANFRLFKVSDQVNGTPTQIGTDYRTNQRGEIIVENLAVGHYYFEEISPPQGYEFVKDTAGQAITKTPFEMKTGEDEFLDLTVYNALLMGELTVRKEVQRSDGSALSDEDKNQAFKFKLTFSQNGQESKETYSYTLNGADLTLKSGETVSLKHGEEAIFPTLPQGLHYQVTEEATAGFVSNATNTVGDVTATPQTAQFTNVVAKGGLKVTKRVSNATASQAQQAFEFTASFSDGKAYHPTINNQVVPLTKDGKFSLQADETATFTEVPDGVAYVVKETAGADFIADVKTITGKIHTGQMADYVVTNQFAPITPTLTGDLVIDKQVLGPAKAGDQFTFKVTFDDKKSYAYTLTSNNQTSSGQLKSGETIKFAAGDSLKILDLPLGTGYQIEETDFGAYQPSLTKVVGQITDAGKAATVTFKNMAPPTLTVVKKVISPTAQPNQSFEFKLIVAGQADQVFQLKADESKTFTLPYGAAYQVVEADYQKDGYYLTSFENNQCAQLTADTTATATNTFFKPELLEIKGEKTWDLANQTVKLPDKIVVQLLDAANIIIAQQEVKPDAQGQWHYQFKAPKYDGLGQAVVYHVREVAVPNYDSSVTGYDILNSYISAATFTPKVEKKLSGETPDRPETFSFTCLSVGQVPVVSQTAEIKGSGQADFKPLTFNQAGTYVYQIYEKTGVLKGYTYDKTSYTLTLVVEKNGSQLVVKSASYENEKGETTSHAIFTNHYQPEVPKPKPPIDPGGSGGTGNSGNSGPSPSSPVPSQTSSPDWLLATGEMASTVLVLAGLGLVSLLYRKWLRDRRK